MPLKPRTLLDIKTRKVNAFSRLSAKVNLTEAVTRITVLKPLKVGLAIFLSFSFLVSFALAPTPQLQAAVETNKQERAALEKELAELEAQIADYENTITGYKKQSATYSAAVKEAQAKISKLNAQVRVLTLSLEKLNSEIEENQGSIEETQQKIALGKEAISRSLQYVYENERESLMLVLLKNPQLSDFSNAVNAVLDVQQSLTETVEEMDRLRVQLEDEKETLALKKSDAVAFKAYQEAQRKSVEAAKKEKDTLLALTVAQQGKYQDLLTTTKKTAAEIRNRLFEFLGGGAMTFEEAYNLAKIAERATGVRAAMVLAVLDHESALGSNVGRCSYKTAMSPGIPARPGRRDDISVFLRLTAALGINPDSVTVSCANSDGAFGGAMGPAQFIPTTWDLYSKRIADIAGKNPPSPWDNGAAIIGTSLYLKDAKAACTSYTGVAQERCMAARYYAGGRWASYLWTYGERVVNKAAQFQQDIDAISS